MLFEELPLSEDILDALYDMRFETCTPIQEKCIPPLLEGRDLIGIAQTGTGKTAAYILPLLSMLQTREHPHDAVNCLIMAPTRELAQQIDQALQGFAYYTQLSGVAIYGGNDGIRFEQENRSLKLGADIVIATPGRLLTHLDLGHLDLSRTSHLVLDEADRMLDMGFSDDILRIIAQMPKQRQTILFSATMPPQIEQLARTVMTNPVSVKIAVSKPAEGIQQEVCLCRQSDKIAITKQFLSEINPQRAILFASRKQTVKELAIQLRGLPIKQEVMHSDLTQPQREAVMQQFRAGNVNLLIATDIVSRGIDIDDIELVMNFDAPHDPEDYVHRVGRTARAGKQGRAITLIGESDYRLLSSIERLLEREIERRPLPQGMKEPDLTSPGSDRGGRRGNRRKTSGKCRTMKDRRSTSKPKQDAGEKKTSRQTSEKKTLSNRNKRRRGKSGAEENS